MPHTCNPRYWGWGGKGSLEPISSRPFWATQKDPSQRGQNTHMHAQVCTQTNLVIIIYWQGDIYFKFASHVLIKVRILQPVS